MKHLVTNYEIFERKKEMYPVGTKVICINDKPRFPGAQFFIKKYEIYEIEDISDDSYKLKDVENWYFSNRFISELEYIAKKYNL